MGRYGADLTFLRPFFTFRLEKSDCPRRDVSPQPACGGNRNLSVAVLERCCDGISACGGFNTHGVIKDISCTATSTSFWTIFSCSSQLHAT